jgi:hypothetical protein
MLPPHALIDASGTPVLRWAQVPPVCHVNERKTRRHHPSSGSLGSHFPTFSGREVSASTRRYYVPLRLPKAHPGSFSCPYSPGTLRTSCVSCPLSGLSGHGRDFPTPGLFVNRLSQFSGKYSARRQLALTGFQAIPVVHALLSDPGGVLDTCHMRIQNCCLPHACRESAFTYRSLNTLS